MKIQIPKKMGHIWIGNKPVPNEWINTWKEHGHTIYDIDASKSEDEIFEEVKKAIQK